MPCSRNEVETLLQQLVDALKASDKWSLLPPNSLVSRAPFACDIMSFEQWLQFVFMPNMQEYMRTEKALPQAMSLYPMAQMCFFDKLSQQLILPVLAKLDRCFAQQDHAA
jgi:uncharacterized protein YqcC (DUF446 family)